MTYVNSKQPFLALDIGVLEIDQYAAATFRTEAVGLATFAEAVGFQLRVAAVSEHDVFALWVNEEIAYNVS